MAKYVRGERVEARKALKGGAIRKGARGKVTHSQQGSTVRVRFQRDPFAYRVVTPGDIRRV